eukprot:scaffold2309_cov248-Pinguiococcus_pyrenoidosus.AAC.4
MKTRVCRSDAYRKCRRDVSKGGPFRQYLQFLPILHATRGESRDRVGVQSKLLEVAERAGGPGQRSAQPVVAQIEAYQVLELLQDLEGVVDAAEAIVRKVQSGQIAKLGDPQQISRQGVEGRERDVQVLPLRICCSVHFPVRDILCIVSALLGPHVSLRPGQVL